MQLAGRRRATVAESFAFLSSGWLRRSQRRSTHPYSRGRNGMRSRYDRVPRVPCELRLCRVLLSRRWAIFHDSQVAHGSRLGLPGLLGLAQGHSSILCRRGPLGAMMAGRLPDGATGRPAPLPRQRQDQRPRAPLRAQGRRGTGRNRGSGRGPQKRRPGEAPAVIWSGYGEAAPRSILNRTQAPLRGPMPLRMPRPGSGFTSALLS